MKMPINSWCLLLVTVTFFHAPKLAVTSFPADSRAQHVGLVGISKLVLVHIPKSGGTSFRFDAQRYLQSDRLTVVPDCGEHSYRRCREMLASKCGTPEGEYTCSYVTFLRNPFTHILSMFLHGKVNPYAEHHPKHPDFPGDESNLYSGFQEWVSHFQRPFFPGHPGGPEQDFNMYNPWNMQSRYFFPSARDQTQAEIHHVYLSQDRTPNITEVIRNMDSMPLVGITELYVESLCIMRYYVHGVLPNTCICEAKYKIGDIPIARSAHGVPKHSLEDVELPILAKLKTFVEADIQLYFHGLEKLKGLAENIYRDTGHSVICSGKMKYLKRQVELLAALCSDSDAA